MQTDTKNNIRPELLAPVGGWDNLEAAVSNGADAVYLGTKEFNARINACNFSFEELGRAVDFSHKNGVRVYLTMNTLVKDREISQFFDTLSRAYSEGIDGVIIQHISFIDVIKRGFPGLKVFVSTQAALGNAAASLLKSADRIILPRELNLKEIKEIIRSGASVEIFVHGALCFSYSGLCLFSSLVSNRSGNRGQCAQLCRQKYNGTYSLSTRELCLVARIPELIQAGITGFKIEGRMRSPLYVAVATRLYRKAIDSYLAGSFAIPQKEMGEIEVVFNREFTEGFIGGAGDIISPEKPMNRGAFLGAMENGEITLQRALNVGDGVGIWGGKAVSGAVIKRMVVGGQPVNAAGAGDKVSLGIDAKDGDRIYLTSSGAITIAPDFTITRPPISAPDRPAAKVTLPQTVSKPSGGVPRLLVKVYSLAEAQAASRAGADTVFYSIFAPDFPSPPEWQEGAVLGAFLPRIMDDAELERAVALLKEKQPGAILAGNAGFLPSRAQFEVPVYLDYSLNCFNGIDIAFFKRYGVVPTLSLELSLDEMTALRDKEAVVFCHGDLVLVNSKIPIQADRLCDEKGLVFPVRQEGGYWQVLNSHPFGLFNDIRRLHSAGFNLFYIDKPGEGARFAALYRNMLQNPVMDRRMRKGYTSGHLFRPVE